MTAPRYMRDRVPNYLRKAKYQVARARGLPVGLSRKIREWRMNKFVDVLHNYPRMKTGTGPTGVNE